MAMICKFSMTERCITICPFNLKTMKEEENDRRTLMPSEDIQTVLLATYSKNIPRMCEPQLVEKIGDKGLVIWSIRDLIFVPLKDQPEDTDWARLHVPSEISGFVVSPKNSPDPFIILFEYSLAIAFVIRPFGKEDIPCRITSVFANTSSQQLLEEHKTLMSHPGISHFPPFRRCYKDPTPFTLSTDLKWLLTHPFDAVYQQESVYQSDRLLIACFSLLNHFVLLSTSNESQADSLMVENAKNNEQLEAMREKQVTPLRVKFSPNGNWVIYIGQYKYDQRLVTKVVRMNTDSLGKSCVYERKQNLHIDNWTELQLDDDGKYLLIRNSPYLHPTDQREPMLCILDLENQNNPLVGVRKVHMPQVHMFKREAVPYILFLTDQYIQVGQEIEKLTRLQLLTVSQKGLEAEPIRSDKTDIISFAMRQGDAENAVVLHSNGHVSIVNSLDPRDSGITKVHFFNFREDAFESPFYDHQFFVGEHGLFFVQMRIDIQNNLRYLQLFAANLNSEDPWEVKWSNKQEGGGNGWAKDGAFIKFMFDGRHFCVVDMVESRLKFITSNNSISVHMGCDFMSLPYFVYFSRHDGRIDVTHQYVKELEDLSDERAIKRVRYYYSEEHDGFVGNNLSMLHVWKLTDESFMEID